MINPAARLSTLVFPPDAVTRWLRLVFLMIREKSDERRPIASSAVFFTWEWGNEYRHCCVQWIIRHVLWISGQLGLIHFAPWKVWNTSMPISAVLASANRCWSFDPNRNLKTKDFLIKSLFYYVEPPTAFKSGRSPWVSLLDLTNEWAAYRNLLSFFPFSQKCNPKYIWTTIYFDGLPWWFCHVALRSLTYLSLWLIRALTAAVGRGGDI